MSAPEYLRLQALARYAVLDTLPEVAFERLARLTSRHFDAPIALVSFIDEHRHWIKAGCGLGVSEIERQDSLCSLVFEGGEVVSTPDAQNDPRFGQRPGALGVRFYASAPLRTRDGHAIGSLCVAAPEPRPDLSPEERADLEDLAALVMDQLELRLHNLDMEREAQARSLYTAELQEALSLAQTLQGVSDLAELDLEPGELLLRATELTAVALGVDWGGLAAVEAERAITVSAWHGPAGADFARQAGRGVKKQEGGLLWRAVARTEPIFVENYPQQQGAHPGLSAAGASSVMSVSLGRQGTATYVMTLVRLGPGQLGTGQPDDGPPDGWPPDEGQPTTRSGQPWSRFDRQLVTAVVRAMRQAVSRRTIQAALQETQEKLRLTLGAGPLVLWATDLSGVFTVSEGRGLEDLGLKAGEAVGHSVEVLYAGAPAVIENVNRALAGETFSTALALGDRTFDTSYAPLLGPEGRQIGAMGVGYDVTPRAHAERQERRARTQAEALVELSRVLDPALDLHDVADSALAALERALGDVWLTLWQRDGDTFESFAHRGQGSPQMVERLQRGIPASGLEKSGVLSGQSLFLNHSQLSEEAVQEGIWGAALLPILVDQPGQEIVLVVSRTSEFAEWSPFERDLLGAAVRTLSTGASRRRQHQRLEDAALTDPLTGLGNRRAFETDLAAALSRAGQGGSTVGVLSIDLDGLKGLNDRRGHLQGDSLLQMFAVALRAGFRSGDRAYRLGGDEYVLVLPNVGPADADRILGRVEQALLTTRQAGFSEIGASAGLACFPADAQDAAELLRLSDLRMYGRKAQKRQAETR